MPRTYQLTLTQKARYTGGDKYTFTVEGGKQGTMYLPQWISRINGKPEERFRFSIDSTSTGLTSASVPSNTLTITECGVCCNDTHNFKDCTVCVGKVCFTCYQKMVQHYSQSGESNDVICPFCRASWGDIL